MARLDDAYAHLEARQGLVPASVLPIALVRAAIRSTVPTRWHAMRLGEALLGALGTRAFRDPSEPDGALAVFLRCPEDEDLLVAQPILTLSKGPGSERVLMTLENPNAVLPEEAPDGWKPGDAPYWPVRLKMQLRPRGPEMCSGKLTLAEGRSEFGLEYDEGGVMGSATETAGDVFTWGRRSTTSPYLVDTLARPPPVPPLSIFLSPELAEGGVAVDVLAALLARGAAPERCRLRVHLPVPTPHGAAGVRHVGMLALRRIVFSGDIPLEARWAVADGLEGKAVAWGATSAEALARFRDEAFRKKPRSPAAATVEADDPPPAAAPPPSGPSKEQREDGTVVVSTGVVTVSIPAVPPRFPWPRPVPANCPALLVPLPEPPQPPAALAAAGFTRVARTLGEMGDVGHVFVRQDRTGFTAIGEHLADLIDVATLDHELERALAAHDRGMESLRRPGDDFSQQRLVVSMFDDERRVRAAPKVCGGEMARELGPAAPQGDLAPWRVLVARGFE